MIKKQIKKTSLFLLGAILCGYLFYVESRLFLKITLFIFWGVFLAIFKQEIKTLIHLIKSNTKRA